MEYDDWQAAVAPKVQGTWNLHNALLAANVNVDFFLLFSSWSGLVGQWGQANYAAANSFLDAFAQYRHDLGLPAATVNIGAMEDIGYLSRNLHQLEHFRAASTHVLYEQDLLDTLELMMYRSRPEDAGSKSSRRAADSEFVSKGQIAIGLRSTQKLSAPNNRTVWKFDPRMAMYYNLEGQDNEVAASGNEQLKLFLGEATIQPAMLDTDDSAVFLATEIGKTLFSFTMKDVADLELDSSPAALGVDSLVSIELRNWFKHKLGVDVTVLEIQSSHSILDLGRHAATLLKSKFAGTEGPQNGEGNEKYLDMKAP
jgi:acyl carrier protein